MRDFDFTELVNVAKNYDSLEEAREDNFSKTEENTPQKTQSDMVSQVNSNEASMFTFHPWAEALAHRIGAGQSEVTQYGLVQVLDTIIRSLDTSNPNFILNFMNHILRYVQSAKDSKVYADPIPAWLDVERLKTQLEEVTGYPVPSNWEDLLVCANKMYEPEDEDWDYDEDEDWDEDEDEDDDEDWGYDEDGDEDEYCEYGEDWYSEGYNAGWYDGRYGSRYQPKLDYIRDQSDAKDYQDGYYDGYNDAKQ